MTRTLLSIICYMLTIAGTHAQPVITATSFTPTPGENFIRHQCNYTGVGDGAGGANLTWDFSSLVPFGPPDTISYTASGPSYLPVYFPTCNLAAELRAPGNKLNSCYTTNTDSIQYVGYYYAMVSPTPIIYGGGPANTMKFPFNFNDSIISNYNDLSGCGGKYFSDSYIYDAYGTLILAGHTYNNVIRIKRVSVDSTYNCGPPPPLTITKGIDHDFYVSGYHYPLVRMHTYVSTGSTIIYISNYQGLLADEQVGNSNAPINIFPNPANGNVNISFTLSEPEDCTITVTDISGRQVGAIPSATCHSGSNTVTYNTGNLSAGSYIVSIIGRNTVQHCNMAVVK